MHELLTVEEIARICHVHEVTVRRHIASGKLPSVRVGRGVRVRQEDLSAYIAPGPGTGARREYTLDGAKPLSEDDPFWALIGSIAADVEPWISGDKQRALAAAYAPKL